MGGHVVKTGFAQEGLDGAESVRIAIIYFKSENKTNSTKSYSWRWRTTGRWEGSPRGLVVASRTLLLSLPDGWSACEPFVGGAQKGLESGKHR